MNAPCVWQVPVPLLPTVLWYTNRECRECEVSLHSSPCPVSPCRAVLCCAVLCLVVPFVCLERLCVKVPYSEFGCLTDQTLGDIASMAWLIYPSRMDGWLCRSQKGWDARTDKRSECVPECLPFVPGPARCLVAVVPERHTLPRVQ